MKKSLLFAAAAFAAVSANAEVFTYDFATTTPFLQELTAAGGNYDFVDKYGSSVNTDGEQFILDPAEEGGKGTAETNRVISLLDGQTYLVTPDDAYTEVYGRGVLPAENLNYPFIGWGEKGVTRTLLMTGWGSMEGWEDKAYNGATEADWVATVNAIAFNRLGTKNMVSRNDTYIQFPAVTGNVTVTVWAGTASDKQSKEQKLNVLVTPVIDGVVTPEQNVSLTKDYGTFPEKRMIKLDPVKFDATGKSVAFRIGCDGNILHIYHVTIEGEKAAAGIENIVVNDFDNTNAPIYNIMGVQVDENYKGLVIKNGKKYIQK